MSGGDFFSLFLMSSAAFSVVYAVVAYLSELLASVGLPKFWAVIIVAVGFALLVSFIIFVCITTRDAIDNRGKEAEDKLEGRIKATEDKLNHRLDTLEALIKSVTKEKSSSGK